MRRLTRPGKLALAALVVALLTGCSDRGSNGKKGGGGTADITPPAISILIPSTASSYSTSCEPLELGGIASDNLGPAALAMVAWENAATGDSGAGLGTTSWSASVPLTLGDNPITATVYDSAGNTGTDSLTVTLASTGNVWSWGSNQDGRLGTGSAVDSAIPVMVRCLSGVTAAAAGRAHALALLDDGTLRAWGDNLFGQLGDGTTVDSTTPLRVQNIGSAIYMAAGRNHSATLLADGSIWTWGANDLGQLGDGTEIERWNPVQVVGITNAITVGTRGRHTVAILADGTARAWGQNTWGALIGDGTSSTTDFRTTPATVANLSDAVDVAAGTSHMVVLLNDGTLRSWGDNTYGQIADGTDIRRPTPVQVVDSSDPTGFLTGVTAIAAGLNHSIALLSNGTIRVWGYNGTGALCNGTNVDEREPIPVQGLSNISAIGAGDNNTFAINSGGTIYGWGSAPLGDGTTVESRDPIDVTAASGLSNIAAITGGDSFAVAID